MEMPCTKSNEDAVPEASAPKIKTDSNAAALPKINKQPMNTKVKQISCNQWGNLKKMSRCFIMSKDRGKILNFALMKKIGFLLTLVCLSGRLFATEPVEVGHWRTHFAPSPILQLAQRQGEIFGLMTTELMYYDKADNRVGELSGIHGLSGTSLTSTAYSAAQGVLIVGYADGRVDLVYDDNDVFTIFDIANKNIQGSKSIHHIFPIGRHAYLSMSFGVVVVDLQKQEIKETYYIGTNNAQVAVNHIGTDGKMIYAATDQGVKYAALSSSNLNDYAAWKTDTLFGKPILFCTEAFGKILVSDGVRIYSGSAQSGWKLFFQLPEYEGTVNAMEGREKHLAIAITDTTEERGHLVVLDENAQTKFSDSNLRVINSLLWDEDDASLWVGMSIGRMNNYDIESKKIDNSYFIQGAVGNQVFSMAATDNGVTMACGGYDESFAPLPLSFGAGRFDNEYWLNYSYGKLVLGGIDPSIMSVTKALQDPQERNHFFFASSLGGVVERTADDKWFVYNADNSPLQNNRINQSDCRVYDMDFDRAGNLWMINALSSEGLVCRFRDGSWKSYDLRAAGNSDARPGKIMVDYWGTKWVIFNRTELSVFKTDGGALQALKVDLNQGNSLQTDKVFCLVEDLLGHVWIGTDRGIKLIDQHAKMFDNPNGGRSSVDVKTIKVPQDGFLIELLSNTSVTDIAVDGANRKWIGTSGNGVYLVSADGLEEIHHFTTENSPLLSDNITALAVYKKTGEVFIGTDKGMIGYRSTAPTTPENSKETARAFPNPVRPGYQGLINVRGLPQNAYVKITDTRGVLIYQGQATGGQLSWDGYALNGKRPDSGVLFVFAADESGTQKLACKIFYVQ